MAQPVGVEVDARGLLQIVGVDFQGAGGDPEKPELTLPFFRKLQKFLRNLGVRDRCMLFLIALALKYVRDDIEGE